MTYMAVTLPKMLLIGDNLSMNYKEAIDEKLYSINRFFNRFDFVDDLVHWNEKDYWATPIEFISTGAGDCEDYTIAKYFSLIELGVPENSCDYVCNSIRITPTSHGAGVL